MKLSFDRTATRKLELWAISCGLELESLNYFDDLAEIVMDLVEAELAKLRPKAEEDQK